MRPFARAHAPSLSLARSLALSGRVSDAPSSAAERAREREREREREQKGDIVSSLPDDSFTEGGIELGPPSYTHSILGWNAEL